jgi:uncharacterized membrane protein YcaP (DUF421 family)
MTAIRLMGKRQVGEMQLSELVTTFMLSELAVNPIQDLSIPISYAILPLVFLLASEVIMSFLMTKSSFLKKVFFGRPSMIIKNGELNQKELARLRIGVSELLGELRLKDVGDISDVEYAVLEPNGKLSVFLKSDKKTVTLQDLKVQGQNDAIAHPIIIDGVINEKSLSYAKKDRAWIDKYLSKQNLKLEKIFLMTITDSEKINIIKKEEK